MFCEIPDSLKTLKYLHIKMYIVYIYETESYIKMIFAITIPDICTENYRTLINNLILEIITHTWCNFYTYLVRYAGQEIALERLSGLSKAQILSSNKSRNQVFHIRSLLLLYLYSNGPDTHKNFINII